jgi:hypothetical protein
MFQAFFKVWKWTKSIISTSNNISLKKNRNFYENFLRSEQKMKFFTL